MKLHTFLNKTSTVYTTRTALFLLTILCSCNNQHPALEDADGNSYSVKAYQGVWWMTENLRTTKDREGQTVNYYYPNEEEETKEEYGLLYDYATACKICPEGWSLPEKQDWENLIAMQKNASAYKEQGYWGNDEATNSTAFSVRPAGYGNSGEHPNKYKSNAVFWSKGGTEEFRWATIFDKGTNEIRSAEQHPVYGFAVRCIKK
jgi:uncharacterized protein (TIGR02145 family)